MKPYRPSPRHIPELNGLRVLLVFIVSWYHIWQQSWWTPHIGTYSLDFLVRAGYVPVDGTILLSGFLLFLPHARAMLLGEGVPDPREFYQKRIMRIVPSYFFVTLLMLFAVAIPYDLYYGNTGLLVKDVIMHLTFTQTFDFQTYIATPIGVASWTVAIEMQAYLIFPLIARWARKNPLGTLSSMAAIALLFRSFVVFWMKDYNMVVNQLINFLDVYALGMAAAILYVKLTTLYPEDRRRFLWQAVATLCVLLAFKGLEELLRDQAGSNGQTAIQAGQMIRRPLFAALLALLTLSLPFAVRPLRFLFGNKLMGFLAAISMNYYLMHQNIAVHLKRIEFPPAEHYPYPNMLAGGPEEPWKYQYTALCFGLSILVAIAITFLVEKPGAWALKKAFRRLEERLAKRNAGQLPE